MGTVGGECDGVMLECEDGGGEEFVVGGRDELEGPVGRRLSGRDGHLVLMSRNGTVKAWCHRGVHVERCIFCSRWSAARDRNENGDGQEGRG